MTDRELQAVLGYERRGGGLVINRQSDLRGVQVGQGVPRRWKARSWVGRLGERAQLGRPPNGTIWPIRPPPTGSWRSPASWRISAARAGSPPGPSSSSDLFGLQPEQEAEWRDLAAALRRAVEAELTERQRQIFVAVVLNGVPLDALVVRYDTNRNAIYKVMFEARRKLRAALAADGYLEPGEPRNP
ncbi:MAG: RNA polymerase sigma factor [Streptosporangiaceae bacterium]